MKRLIVITGPTAGGKTALSVAVAKHFQTSIVSADSRQFYKELSIGTAKPDSYEQEGVTHFFIDSHSVEDEVTAARFEKEGLAILEKEFKSKDYVVLTGGSGMFIDALCFGLDQIPTDVNVRNKLQEQLENQGLEQLRKQLKEKDPEYFSSADTENPRRVIRALEAIQITGEKYSVLRKNNTAQRPFEIDIFVIAHQRELLYEKINHRVDNMIEKGLVEEVRSVLRFRNMTSLNTVGYKELFDFFDKKTDLATAVDTIKRNTRRYAKRQLTWFRRYENAHWIPFNETGKMRDEIIQVLNSKKKRGG